mmetsp:Transcript_17768/g.38422  ORF Transcript_17768/g.38422 Transcript_17768/m.38422 type:complete len:213 (-) Transcript_17768:616-1254(-)
MRLLLPLMPHHLRCRRKTQLERGELMITAGVDCCALLRALPTKSCTCLTKSDALDPAKMRRLMRSLPLRPCCPAAASRADRLRVRPARATRAAMTSSPARPLFWHRMELLPPRMELLPPRRGRLLPRRGLLPRRSRLLPLRRILLALRRKVLAPRRRLWLLLPRRGLLPLRKGVLLMRRTASPLSPTLLLSLPLAWLMPCTFVVRNAASVEL